MVVLRQLFDDSLHLLLQLLHPGNNMEYSSIYFVYWILPVLPAAVKKYPEVVLQLFQSKVNNNDDDDDEELTPGSSPPACSDSGTPETSSHWTPEEEPSEAAVPAATHTHR